MNAVVAEYVMSVFRDLGELLFDLLQITQLGVDRICRIDKVAEFDDRIHA